MFVRLLLILCYLFFSFLGNGQTERFSHLTTDDGLPENTGQAILQDKDGFLWIGTQNGLVRYDGYEFIIFQNQPDDSTSLSNNFIQSLFEDRDGYLWVGTRSGLNRYHPRQNYFERFFPDSTTYHGDNWLKYDILQTPDGHIWTSSFNTVFEILDWEKRKVRRYDLENSTQAHNALELGKNKQVLVGIDNRLLEFNGENFSKVLQIDATISDVTYLNETIYLGSKKGIWEVKEDEAQLIPAFGATSGSVHLFLRKDQQGRLWLGTSAGVYLLSMEDNKATQSKHQVIAHFKNSASESSSLSHNVALSWWQDRQGLIWIGTGQGINITDPLSQQVIRISADTSHPFQLPNNNVKTLLFDQKENLWIGTLSGLLYLQYDKTPRFTKQDQPPRLQGKKLFSKQSKTDFHLADDNITSLAKINDHLVWIGTSEGYVYFFDLEKEQLSELKLPRPTRQIRGFALDKSQQHIWIGTGEGLFCYDLISKQFRDLKKLDLINFVFGFAMIDHQLWVSHYNGLYNIDLQTLDYEHFEQTQGPPRHPSNNLMSFIYPTDSVLWISTFGGGLNKFSRKSKTFYPYNQSHGLKSLNIWCSYPDQYQRLWMTTDDGVSFLDLTTERVLNFSQKDGFNFDDFSLLSHTQSPLGELLFANPKGLNIFNPNDFQIDTLQPIVELTNVELNYQSLTFGTSHEKWESISDHSFLQLTPDEKVITFKFSGLNFRDATSTLYNFRLQGYDSNWKERGSNERYVTYNNLPHGKYTFEVKAKNPKGNGWGKIKQIHLEILPPFYKTFWFRALASIAIIGGIIGLVYVYHRRKYLRQIRALQIERELQTERERISRDLHDNIGAQLTNITFKLDLAAYQSKNDSDSKQIERISDDTRNTMKLLRDTIWALQKDEFSLKDLANKLQAYVNRLEDIHLNFEIKKKLETNWILSPKEVLHIFRIIQEAIQNIIKHAEASEVEIIFISNTQQFEIKVSDNGIGFSLLNEKSNKHYGLENMAFRAKEIGADFRVKKNHPQGTSIHIMKSK